MAALIDSFPDAKTMLALQPEDLGPVLLAAIHSELGGAKQFNIASFCVAFEFSDPAKWPKHLRPAIEDGIAEALSWLYRVSLIMPAHGATTPYGYWSLTRRGAEVRTREAAVHYGDVMLLP